MITTTPSRVRGGVGESAVRVDAIPKVTGTFDYASDLLGRRDALGGNAAIAAPARADPSC